MTNLEAGFLIEMAQSACPVQDTGGTCIDSCASVPFPTIRLLIPELERDLGQITPTRAQLNVTSFAGMGGPLYFRNRCRG